MTDTSNLTVGQAEIYFAEGVASPTSATMPDTQSLGNIVTSGINPEVSYVEHYSRIKGKKVKDEEFVITNGLNINFTFDEINEKNIERFLLGNLADPSTITDYSASGNNDGTVYGDPKWVTGKKGYALDFGPTTNDYIEIVSPSGLSSSEVSVSAWVYINAMESYHGFVRHNWANPGSWLLYTSSTQIVFGVYDTDRRRAAYACDISGEWHHLVGTFDGTTIRLYLDGSEIGISSTASVSLDTTSPIKISSDTYAKKIDEVRIYNRAISQAEITNLYNLSNEATTGLVLYYPFPKKLPVMTKNGIRGRSVLKFNTNVGEKFLYIIPKCVLKSDGGMNLTSDKWVEGNFKLDILYHNTYHVGNDSNASQAPFGYIDFDTNVIGSPF